MQPFVVYVFAAKGFAEVCHHIHEVDHLPTDECHSAPVACRASA